MESVFSLLIENSCHIIKLIPDIFSSISLENEWILKIYLGTYFTCRNLIFKIMYFCNPQYPQIFFLLKHSLELHLSGSEL